MVRNIFLYVAKSASEEWPMRYDLAVVGHIVLDYIIDREGIVHGPKLGGPCTYSSLGARALGASAIAVSRVGRDFGRKRVSWLHSHGISVNHIRISNSLTTSFKINYRNAGRNMQVTSVCDPLGREDLSKFPHSLAIHMGPILNEIPPRIAMRLAELNSVLSLDPQGYLRRLASDGSVRIRSWRNSSLLKRLAVLKVSENELTTIAGENHSFRRLSKLGPDIILLTRGVKGMIVWSRKEGTFRMPAYETRVRDPTGAGDALVGAFLTSWVHAGDLLWSAAVGSAVASFVVAKFGPATFGTRRQIESRAKRILDRTVRVRKTRG